MKKVLLGTLFIFILIPVLHCKSEHTDSTYQHNQDVLKIRFSFTDKVSKTPVSGRIILGFHNNPLMQVNNPDLFDPQPTFVWNVSDWKPGESIVLDSRNATSWMGNLDSLNGWYGVQAVLKTNIKARSFEAEGNAITLKNVVYIEKGKMCRPLDLLFTSPATKSRNFAEEEFIKEVKIESPLLTEFYGEPDSLKAAVILPKSYFTDSTRTYPSVYVFGGWGATHFEAVINFFQKRYGMYGFGEEKVFIYVNHECRTGYHVFCSSETNGPREETFFRELVPFIEKKYRVNLNPQTRFLMGQSSGAWAGLWLLIKYPDQFGGAYAGSPDPVDFTDFTGTNIYEKNANMFFNSKGEIKYLFEKISMKDFTGLDRIAGWGEQMYSFDATFSKIDYNGQPQHLFNWDSGVINPDVAISWETHDLSKVISGMDRAKLNLLQGKIHIYVAADDFFGLNRPVQTFQKVLQKIGLDADIRFPPSGGHNVWTNELRTTIHNDIDNTVHAATVQPPKSY